MQNVRRILKYKIQLPFFTTAFECIKPTAPLQSDFAYLEKCLLITPEFPYSRIGRTYLNNTSRDHPVMGNFCLKVAKEKQWKSDFQFSLP